MKETQKGILLKDSIQPSVNPDLILRQTPPKWVKVSKISTEGAQDCVPETKNLLLQLMARILL